MTQTSGCLPWGHRQVSWTRAATRDTGADGRDEDPAVGDNLRYAKALPRMELAGEVLCLA